MDADTASISQATGSEARDQHRGTMTGGLATAIAALAERQTLNPKQPALESLETSNIEQVEVGSSSCAHSHDLSMNSPVFAKLTRPGEPVMLPQTFEEQMMLAMALSITDAQSRARLEDSHPRPLPNVS